MSAGSIRESIPHYSTSLIGRDDERALLERLIFDPDVTLITVTGATGIGKTRLASTVASSVQDQFDDGALFVPLENIIDPALVPNEIGKALGLQSDAHVEAIHARLGSWRGIVLLDNLEQVIESAPEIARMLPLNPNLTVLVTSQRPLQIDGERVLRLQPLSLPDANASTDIIRSSASVQLLVDRASQQDTSFTETVQEETSVQAIAEICRRLDGIPLAMELAASRLASLSPEVVLAQLERGQGILSGGRVDAPERQRTMRAAIGWSYDLLPEEARRLFLWLGAFSAGFDLEIVERLSRHLGSHTAAVDSVSDLMHLNLIRRVNGGANLWYSMLVPMREFCITELEDSGTRSAAESFVADYVIDLAHEAKSELNGPNVGEWLVRIDREVPTIRSAVRWALDTNAPQIPLIVVDGLQEFFDQRGMWREAIGWIDEAWLKRDVISDEVMIDGMLAKLAMQAQAFDLENAVATDAVVRDLLDGTHHLKQEVQYWLVSGCLSVDLQQWDDAEWKFLRTQQLAEQEGVERAARAALANLGNIAFSRGHFDAAEDYYQRAKVLFDKAGNESASALLLSNLAAVANSQGQFERSLAYLHEASDIQARHGLRLNRVLTLINLSGAYLFLKDLDASEAAAEEVILEARELGNDQMAVMGFIALTASAMVKKDASLMGRHLAQALALQAQAQGANEYVKIGFFLAFALSMKHRYRDATAVLAKSLAYGQEFEFTIEDELQQSIHELEQELRSHCADFEATWQNGESWSNETFYRNLTAFTHRLNMATPGGLLVTVPAAAGPDLTPREREILNLLCEGNSTQSLADRLSVSPRTVTTHIANIMAKYDVSSRAELVAKAMRPVQ